MSSALTLDMENPHQYTMMDGETGNISIDQGEEWGKCRLNTCSRNITKAALKWQFIKCLIYVIISPLIKNVNVYFSGPYTCIKVMWRECFRAL